MATTLLASVPIPEGHRRWTIEEFERLPDDLFSEGERLELIDGLIYTKMGQNDPHTTALRAVFAALQTAFGPGFNLSMQTPLKLGEMNKPEPGMLQFCAALGATTTGIAPILLPTCRSWSK